MESLLKGLRCLLVTIFICNKNWWASKRQKSLKCNKNPFCLHWKILQMLHRGIVFEFPSGAFSLVRFLFLLKCKFWDASTEIVFAPSSVYESSNGVEIYSIPVKHFKAPKKSVIWSSCYIDADCYFNFYAVTHPKTENKFWCWTFFCFKR